MTDLYGARIGLLLLFFLSVFVIVFRNQSFVKNSLFTKVWLFGNFHYTEKALIWAWSLVGAYALTFFLITLTENVFIIKLLLVLLGILLLIGVWKMPKKRIT